MNRDPATRDYVAKRKSQGRTKKEIIRSLKRYITRQIYRALNQAAQARHAVELTSSVSFCS